MAKPKDMFHAGITRVTRLLARYQRSAASSGTWSLVSTMRGTPDIVAPFVAHHLLSDAVVIHIYLDEANPAVEAMLAPLAPRVLVTVCDAAYWARSRFGKKPDVIIARQVFNAEHARQTTPGAWLVHIDSDEFLAPTEPGAPDLASELVAVPGDMHWVRLTHMERVFVRDTEPQSIFDGVFRRRIADKALLQEIYGPGSRFLRQGYSGYTRGKIAMRVQSPLRIHIHTGTWRGQSGEAPEAELPPFVVIGGTQVVHLDGWTPLQWTAKLLRRVDTNRIDSGHPGRRAQLHYMNDAVSLSQRLALFEMIQTLPQDKIDRLLQMRLMTDRPFDPRPAVARTFPGRQFSFSIADFDAGLRNSDPDFFARYGLVT
jgi:hypothetical protein